MTHILNVEDDWLKVSTIRRMVEGAGYEYRHAKNLAEFERMLEESRPVAVITDWRFPLGRAKRDDDPEPPECGGAVTAACATLDLPCLVFSGSMNPGPDELRGAWWYYVPQDFRHWIMAVESKK